MTERDKRAEQRRRREQLEEQENRAKNSVKKRTKKRRQPEEIEEPRNTAKSKHTPDKKRKKTREKERKRSKKQIRKQERRNRVSRNIGIGLAAFQLLASIIFMISVFCLGMLPARYIAILIVLLILLCGLLLVGQMFSRKNAIIGKIASIVITIVLLVGAFFLFKTSGAISSITGGEYKVDNMVVAVLTDDPAEELADAADYIFGVQYALGSDETTAAIEAIEDELGTTITTVEYTDMAALAVGLQEEEVGAIIYNEAYAGIIEDDNQTFETDIRIIYEHEITSALDMVTETASTKEVESETFTVYISGIDVYGSISKTSRSDVNILATINPTTGEILLVTTPRDYYVELVGVGNGSYDKLTHAGIYGVDTSIATLENLYDVDIDFYVRVNFTSLVEIVDALGGITVDSDYSFSSDATPSGSTVYFSAGENTLDGSSALAFCRERYNVPGGDNQRGINQQAVIVGIIEKAISPSILTGATQLIASVSDNFETNMTDTQIQNLIKMQIDEMIDWEITSVAATGTDSYSSNTYSSSGTSLYVMMPDYDVVDEISAMIQAMYEVDTDATDDTEEDAEDDVEVVIQ